MGLYRSSEMPDVDEVALTIRVRCPPSERHGKGAGEDRCLAEIRDRLAEVGVPRT